ncbi:hypothetical protein QT327_21355 [Olivibacter sp. 47]|uniref:hypothetical protein n=1 Tax=Olivibacter sp. 47 TaxID=3056486 RepID=UPI0025A3D17D|nr:hypothetical protein [Olivibacter sp. 47]MDM8176864.1 hypothetical protein [Olivibacter sp. 47]
MEKMLFLGKRGFSIIYKSTETHIHGSRFVDEGKKEAFAIKQGKELPVDTAFHEELKKALISL